MRILCCQQFLCRLQCMARELIVGCLQLFTRSCRLAACQNSNYQPGVCILICLLYFNCWDTLSLSLLPLLGSSEVPGDSRDKKPFAQRPCSLSGTLSEPWAPGKFIGLDVAEIFISIFQVFVPIMLHLLFSDEGFYHKMTELQV